MAPPEVVSTVPFPLARTVIERPLLYSGPMVVAVLREIDPKTQTRRGVTRLAGFGQITEFGPSDTPGYDWHFRDSAMRWHDITNARLLECSPYGQPGDRLWVRETHFAFGRWETRYRAKKGRDEWHFVDMTVECGKAYLYDADKPRPQPLAGKRDGGVTPKWWKRPAIFMPRTACRIDLDLTAVRIERLQGISKQDAQAEGITFTDYGRKCGHSGKGWTEIGDCPAAAETHPQLPGWGVEPTSHAQCMHSAPAAFASLWSQINGPDSWAANPWVWVVEFKVVRP